MEDFEGLLKGLKLKVTPRRRAVLEVMAAESTFLSPEELQRKMGASRQERRSSHGISHPGRACQEGGVITRWLP